MKPVYIITGLVLLSLAVVSGLLLYLPGEDPVPAGSSAGPAGSDEDTYQAGPFRVAVSLDPETPVTGKNTLLLRVRDAEDRPVSGVELSALAEMPAMGAMPAMRAPVEFREVSPGRYEGTFTLSMDGAWPLTIELEKADIGRARLGFDMNTRSRGVRLTSGANGGSNDQEDGTIFVDSRRRQSIGLQTGTVSRAEFVKEIRAAGEVVYDETRLADVSLRFDAWIGELRADYVGKAVRRGEILFTAYGPELLAAQLEYLEALKREAGDTLVAAARRRLALLGMEGSQIRQLEQNRQALDYVPIIAPRSGTVVEKHIVQGSAQRAGVNTLRIADLSAVWVEAEVYESELDLIHKGMEAVIRLPDLPGRSFPARIDYIYPYLDEDTRTGRVRFHLENPDGVLKPEMYAEVRLLANLGERLRVPEEAVLFAGDTRVVFRDLGNGELQPVRIRTGHRSADFVEVLEGLQEGDRIVTSGTFLIAAESKLKSGIKQW